jgi:hypothetical protein
MEHIKKAIERAKQERLHLAGPAHSPMRRLTGTCAPEAAAAATNGSLPRDPAQVVAIDRRHLQAMRIVAHDATEGRATHYDMLRTQVLQRMEAAACQDIAVTSPRLGCGKTVTAINLALSIARQSEQPSCWWTSTCASRRWRDISGCTPRPGSMMSLQAGASCRRPCSCPTCAATGSQSWRPRSPVPNPVEHLVSSAMKTTLSQAQEELRPPDHHLRPAADAVVRRFSRLSAPGRLRSSGRVVRRVDRPRHRRMRTFDRSRKVPWLCPEQGHGGGDRPTS